MKNKKNNLIIALTSLTAIMGLLVSSGRIHKMLSAGSSISVIEFYLILLIFGLIICIMIIMFNNKKEAKQDDEMLRKEITEEYKDYVRTETKVIYEKIDQITNSIKDFKKDLKDTLKEIKDRNRSTNNRIDILLNNVKS